MAGKGGGAWKVAYADFATAMMAFFLVMWITSQNKAVKESVAQYFENPLGTSASARATSVHGIPGASAEAELEGEQAGPHGSSAREKGTHSSGSPSEESHPGGRPQLHIFDRLDNTRSVGTMVMFKDDSVELSKDAQHQLGELAHELRGKPHKVEIRGHSTRVRVLNEDMALARWNLCYSRSVAVMKFLMSCGIEPYRFRLSQDAMFEPYSDYGNPVVDPRNDRVEVSAIDELISEHKSSIERRAGDFVPDSAVNAVPDSAPKAEPPASHHPSPKHAH